MKKRIALITHETSAVGGLPTMTAFLHRTLCSSGRYGVDLFSLATSVSDSASLRLASPGTWRGNPRIEKLQWRDLEFTHSGAWGSELEFQRYRPRRKLTELLKSYDLMQFIVGSPPWACAAKHVGRPILIWTATTTRADRETQIRNGSLPRRGWSSFMVPITERYEREALKRADLVFALSEYTRSAVEPIAGANKVVLAPCGVDTELFRPTSVSRGDYILCVARLSDPRKNVSLLLHAYSQLKMRLGRVPSLCLVGELPSDESRALLETLDITSNVRLLGPKQGEELAQLYRNALFFVLSSNEEGLGIVILEAMASGLPVVSTACGGPATAIEDSRSGFLTQTGDLEGFSTAMEKLVREPLLRERMGKIGRQIVTDRFSLGAAGKVFLDSYARVLKTETIRTEQETRVQDEPVFFVDLAQ